MALSNRLGNRTLNDEDIYEMIQRRQGHAKPKIDANPRAPVLTEVAIDPAAYGGLDEGIPADQLFDPSGGADAAFDKQFDENAAQTRKTLEQEINEEIAKLKAVGPSNQGGSVEPSTAPVQNPTMPGSPVSVLEANRAGRGSGPSDGGKSDAEWTRTLIEKEQKQGKPATTVRTEVKKERSPFDSEFNPKQSKGKPGDYDITKNELPSNEPSVLEDDAVFNVIDVALGAAGIVAGAKALWKTGAKDFIVKMFKRNPEKAIETAKTLARGGGQSPSLKAATQEIKDIANPWARDTGAFVEKWAEKPAKKVVEKAAKGGPKPKSRVTSVMSKKGQKKAAALEN